MAGGLGDAPSQGMDRMAQLTARERDIVFYAIVSLKEALNVDMDKLSGLLNNSNVRSTGNGLRLVMKKINPEYGGLKGKTVSRPAIGSSSKFSTTVDKDDESDSSPEPSRNASPALPSTPKRKHPSDDSMRSSPPSALPRLSLNTPKTPASPETPSSKKVKTAEKGTAKNNVPTSPTPLSKKTGRDTQVKAAIPTFRKKPGPVAKASIGTMNLVDCLYGIKSGKTMKANKADSKSLDEDANDDDDNDDDDDQYV